MTEAEWLACTDPVAMIKASRSRLKHRKLRLFAVACCRCIWNALPDERSHRAVCVAERYADGLASDRELRLAGEAAHAALREMFDHQGKRGSCLEAAAAYAADPMAFHAAKNASWGSEKAREVGVKSARFALQARLVRDIISNPHRPVTFDPFWLAWNDGTVVRLAQAAYEERLLPAGTLDNDRLAVLADGLEEAGCTDADILGHLRGSGPHVRGCWPLDLCLGKD